MKRVILVVQCCVLALGLWGASFAGTLPDGFVYVDEVVPSVRLEIRYFTTNNFLGEPVDGYRVPRAILTRPSAEALGRVAAELKPFGLGLKVFDGYRPQRAVDHFVRWAKDLGDLRMKNMYYPNVDKENLFRDDYIAAKSGHSRGSTVDLTMVSLAGDGTSEIDMGGGFDLFDPISWPASPVPDASQRAHRMLLQSVMMKHGFRPYPQEWWHFTLDKEPYSETYFDFPIE
jgi:D-alanyl-D-alanine dipeptidase